MHATNPQINCCLNQLYCYFGSVLICIHNGILSFRKIDFLYYVTLYTFRVKNLPEDPELNVLLSLCQFHQ